MTHGNPPPLRRRPTISGKSKLVPFNLCGHGHFDRQAYTDQFAGKLTDPGYDEAELRASLAHLPAAAAA